MQKTWKVKIITYDLNHDLIFYCTHNESILCESVFRVLGTYNFAKILENVDL